MTREEQINEMAKTISQFITADKDMQVAFADCLCRGAKWADTHPYNDEEYSNENADNEKGDL